MYSLMDEIKDSIHAKQKDIINLCLKLKISFYYSMNHDGDNTCLTVYFEGSNEITVRFNKTDEVFSRNDIRNLDIIYSDLRKLDEEF